jgi:hypothetical protein
MRSSRLAIALCLLMAGAAILLAFSARAAADWPPISQDELAMRDNPAEPGANAMIFYREVLVNSVDSSENYYVRIKVFTGEGKKYGDVEIPYIKGDAQVNDLHARTIHPDGKIIEFNSKVMEKLVVKAGDIKILEKTFTLPDVTPGSIIEYRYKIQRDANSFYNITWRLQEELFTRRAHFVFKPYMSPGSPQLLWRTLRAPGVSPQKQKDGSYALDINDVAGLADEDFMLPQDELRGRVEFIYTREEYAKDSKEYWDRIAKVFAEYEDKFVGKRSSIRDVVSQVTKPTDSAEEKLRKLYARAQQVHNLDEEPSKSTQEEKRQKSKDNNNVEDILKHGYGGNDDIDRFFVALAQAAGFESSVVNLTPRSRGLFHRDLQDWHELVDDLIVWVHAGDKDYYLDPAVHLCPFGILPWSETSIMGMRPTKQGAVFVTIPAIPSSSSITERKLQLTLDLDGSLSGTLTVRFTGERALTYRQNEREDDETGKKKFITDKVKEWLPSTAKFDLTSVTGWDTPETPLEAQGNLRIAGMGETVGRRILLPIGLYEAGQRQLFDASARKQDIYFHYAYEDVDDIAIQLPTGVQASSLPAPQVLDPGGQLKYEISVKKEGSVLHVQRRLTVGGIIYPVAYYSAIRQFFSTAKSNDEQQLVLQAPSSGNN